jgi:hypothetical protein
MFGCRQRLKAWPEEETRLTLQGVQLSPNRSWSRFIRFLTDVRAGPHQIQITLSNGFPQ